MFPILYKVEVFPPQRPYLEIDLQILNNFLTVYFLIIIKINDYGIIIFKEKFIVLSCNL